MRRYGRFGRHSERQVLTKAKLREMLEQEDTAMHWSFEGRKLTAAVQFLSWRPPWVKPRQGADDVETFIDDEHRVEDRHGLGRIPGLWWTLNPKYNALYEIHRLNVRAQLGREAVASFDDNTSDVRFDFVRSAPDLVAYMVALRTELSMRVVMPALVPASDAEPYLCMARFEAGDSGNPHFHGFNVGAGGPRLGRVLGDVAADPQDDQGEVSDDDGADPEETLREERATAADDVSGDDADGEEAAEVPPPPSLLGERRPKQPRRRLLKVSETLRPMPDVRDEHNAHVQNQSDMERIFAEYFGDLVSEWNPCCGDDGEVRFFWDEDVGSHDVEVENGAGVGVNAACPERARLRCVLDAVFDVEDGAPVDLTPVRRLVAALVQSSGRHKLHKMGPPTLGKHPCARGSPQCPVCRYGFPLDLVGRGGARPMRLDKGDKLGAWFARFPRNDRLCCNYEAHVLLDNLGNIDWRPCMNLWAVCEYVTKYATKAPKGTKRLGDVLHAAVDEVCKYEPDNQGVDMLRKSLQKVFAKTVGDRDYGIFEAVHLGLRLPLVFSLAECVSLNTAGARVLRRRAVIQAGPDDAPVTWDSKIDKFDDRKALVLDKQAKSGTITVDEVRYVSLYEFWWKFRQVQGKLVRETLANQRVLMVTPSFSADCASVLSDRHSDYARTAVIAHWRMMPTDERRRRLAERASLEPSRLAVSDPRRTMEWGSTVFREVGGRLLGVEDLFRKFDTDRVDSKGRKVSWAFALMEMLVDPMLVAWVPSWVREQYERRNPYFRACLRQAVDTCAEPHLDLQALVQKRAKRRGPKAVADPQSVKDLTEEAEEKTPNPYFLPVERRTNWHLLRLVRRRMILRFLRRKDDPTGGADGDDEGSAVSDDDGRKGAGGAVSDESAGDAVEDPVDRAREESEMVRDERPTADGVEQLEPGVSEWDRASAEQQLSAAHSAPAAPDVSLGVPSAGLHVDGTSVNPREYAWHLMEGNVCPSADRRFRQSWSTWREAGAAARGDGVSYEELDVWAKFAYDIVAKKAAERDDWLGESRGGYRPRRTTLPLRLILTGGAGSGKSTTVRALVRARRERTSRRLAGVLGVKQRQQQLKSTCVLSAPTGTASFQMKYGATTAHRAWSVPVGFCAPLKRDGKAFERLQGMLRDADLAIFDEFSMLGKAFVGKLLFRVEDAQPEHTSESLFGLDAILAGHLAQAAPIGDDPVYKEGPYKGKGLNKPPDNYSGPEPPSVADFVDKARLFLDEFQDVAMLLETHRVDESGDATWSDARRAQYQRDAQRFLQVTRRMADLEWTREDRRFLASRNASALLSTEEGRAVYEREFKDAPLLMDTKKPTARQEDGADRYNAERLERLAREKGVPILGIRAIHKRPKGSVPERMDDDQFRGLRLSCGCASARVCL